MDSRVAYLCIAVMAYRYHRDMVKLIVSMMMVVLAAICKTNGDGVFPCGPCSCAPPLHVTLVADCSGRNLSAVPQTLPVTLTELNASNNAITSLATSLHMYINLETLDLSTNLISAYRENDFATLHNLRALNLSNNTVPLKDDAYPQLLFQHLGNLSTLDLQFNSQPVLPDSAYPDTSLSHLTSLRALRIDGLRHPRFGRGFAALKNLTTLWLDGYCGVRSLMNDTFSYLSSLRYLFLSDCDVLYIEPATFSPLLNIHTINLDLNRYLTLGNLGQALYGVQKTPLKVLSANSVYTAHGSCVVIRGEDMQYLPNTQIEELHLDGNRIELLEPVTVLNMPPKLKRLSAVNNSFKFGLYIFLIGTAARHLEWVDVSHQDVSVSDPFHIWVYLNSSQHAQRHEQDCVTSSSRDKRLDNNTQLALQNTLSVNLQGIFTFSIPPNLLFANISHSMLSNDITTLQFNNNNLQVLDMSFNFFTKVKGSVVGLNKLQFLDMSYNCCDFIGENLNSLPSLRVLNLSSNFLGYALGNRSFYNLTNLEHLDLSNNKISALPVGIFDQLSSLIYLDLSCNYLVSWSASIETLVGLQGLNLTSNMFPDLPRTLRSQLNSRRNKGLKVEFDDNPLKCECASLPYLEWLQDRGSKVVDISLLECRDSDGTMLNMTDLKEVIFRIDKACTSYVGVAFGSLAVLLIVTSLSIAGVTYRHRWKLRYLYYRTRGYVPAKNDIHDYEFDAFVSYADEDRAFVVTAMRHFLEETENPDERLRLCIRDREFLVGEVFAVNIVKSIASSRMTLIVLSRSFLKDCWRRYELEMAKVEGIERGGQNILLVVSLEDIPLNDLPPDIVHLFKDDSYVEFTEDEQDQRVFWMDLKSAVKP